MSNWPKYNISDHLVTGADECECLNEWCPDLECGVAWPCRCCLVAHADAQAARADKAEAAIAGLQEALDVWDEQYRGFYGLHDHEYIDDLGVERLPHAVVRTDYVRAALDGGAASAVLALAEAKATIDHLTADTIYGGAE